MIRTILAVTAVAIGVSLAGAQSDPLAERKLLMKGNADGARNVNRMVRAEDPFDVAKVNAAFAQWTETAEKLPGLFPEPPKPGQDTRALPKIWETKADFDAKIASFGKAVADSKGQGEDARRAQGRISNREQGLQRLPRTLPAAATAIGPLRNIGK